MKIDQSKYLGKDIYSATNIFSVEKTVSLVGG